MSILINIAHYIYGGKNQVPEQNQTANDSLIIRSLKMIRFQEIITQL